MSGENPGINEIPGGIAVVDILCNDEAMAVVPGSSTRRAAVLDTLAERSRSEMTGVLARLCNDGYPSAELAEK